jgi:hypothetical protein
MADYNISYADFERARKILDEAPYHPLGTIYVAGPMTGYPEFNFPAFFETAEALEEGGWEVINPAAHDLSEFGDLEGVAKNANYRDCLGWDLDQICKNCTAIFMLKGWENSKGARAEHATALALGLEIIYENV